MKKLILISVSLFLFTSCVIQRKTIRLTNGEYITKKQHDKLVDEAFEEAFGNSKYLFNDTDTDIILNIDSTNVK